MVVLPDHLHAVWTLPEGDPDFATRWRLIKSAFSHSFATGERVSDRTGAAGQGLAVFVVPSHDRFWSLSGGLGRRCLDRWRKFRRTAVALI
jgi:REP element-mobilizing transposase RayT